MSLNEPSTLTLPCKHSRCEATLWLHMHADLILLLLKPSKVAARPCTTWMLGRSICATCSGATAVDCMTAELGLQVCNLMLFLAINDIYTSNNPARLARSVFWLNLAMWTCWNTVCPPFSEWEGPASCCSCAREQHRHSRQHALDHLVECRCCCLPFYTAFMHGLDIAIAHGHVGKGCVVGMLQCLLTCSPCRRFYPT